MTKPLAEKIIDDDYYTRNCQGDRKPTFYYLE